MLHPDNVRQAPTSNNTESSEILLDFPILAEAIEQMILSRYHLAPEKEMWSVDAKNFLSWHSAWIIEGSNEGEIIWQNKV